MYFFGRRINISAKSARKMLMKLIAGFKRERMSQRLQRSQIAGFTKRRPDLRLCHHDRKFW